MTLTAEHLRLLLLAIAVLILIAYCGVDAWRGARDRDGTEP